MAQIEKAVMSAGERPRRMSKQAPGPSGEYIDARQPTPLYHQIYTILRDEIVNGVHQCDPCRVGVAHVRLIRSMFGLFLPS